jgi:hypothetical protein
VEPDANGYASPRGLACTLPEKSFDVVIAMSRFWSERGYLCGRMSMGDPAAFHELAKFDAGAAELASSVALTARTLAGERSP